MIKHNNYFEGNVQSLGFTQNNNDMTVGVMMAGDHDFGVATRAEVMKVITGHLIINGKQCCPTDEQPCLIKEGSKINISTSETSSYLCSYK